MLEGYISEYLASYVGQFLEVKREQLKFSLCEWLYNRHTAEGRGRESVLLHGCRWQDRHRAAQCQNQSRGICCPRPAI